MCARAAGTCIQSWLVRNENQSFHYYVPRAVRYLRILVYNSGTERVTEERFASYIFDNAHV